MWQKRSRDPGRDVRRAHLQQGCDLGNLEPPVGERHVPRRRQHRHGDRGRQRPAARRRLEQAAPPGMDHRQIEVLAGRRRRKSGQPRRLHDRQPAMAAQTACREVALERSTALLGRAAVVAADQGRARPEIADTDRIRGCDPERTAKIAQGGRRRMPAAVEDRPADYGWNRDFMRLERAPPHRCPRISCQPRAANGEAMPGAQVDSGHATDRVPLPPGGDDPPVRDPTGFDCHLAGAVSHDPPTKLAPRFDGRVDHHGIPSEPASNRHGPISLTSR